MYGSLCGYLMLIEVLLRTFAGFSRLGRDSSAKRVASVGVEPTTFALLARRSNQLS